MGLKVPRCMVCGTGHWANEGCPPGEVVGGVYVFADASEVLPSVEVEVFPDPVPARKFRREKTQLVDQSDEIEALRAEVEFLRGSLVECPVCAERKRKDRLRQRRNRGSK